MTKALRVLFIDDNEDDMFLVLHVLQKNGYEVPTSVSRLLPGWKMRSRE